MKYVTNNVFSTVEDAFKLIKDSYVIVTAMAACEPRLFFENVHRLLPKNTNITVICANPSQLYPCFSQSATSQVRFEVLFLTHHVRNAQGRGFVHYIPQHLSQWTSNLLRNTKIDMFWGTCSTPDPRGFSTLGLGCVYESEIFRKASIRVMELNPSLPTTFGDTTIQMSDIECLLSNDHALPELGTSTPNDVDRSIAKNVASLVQNGSTIQLGIGSIPNALAVELSKKRNLGIHTEMINDAMVDLYESGAVTGKMKSLWPERMVGAFAYGSRKLYDFIDRNPMVELHPASVVNDPYRIGRNHLMTSINTTVEIDITGQVCSESVGHQELSGVGGAADTHVGAQRSQGGRGIIALHSSVMNRKTGKLQSKVVISLKDGAKVSISRNDVDTVVTEYGIAELRGKNVGKRALSLIQIAHPEFRDQLKADAIKFGYV